MLETVGNNLGISVPTAVPLAEWRAHPATDQAAVIVDCGVISPDNVVPGEISASCGRAAYEYIRAAIEDAIAGRVAAVATAPIQKEAFHAAGVNFPGHTELFAALTQTSRYCMMLACDEYAVGFVTTHVALADVAKHLTKERVLDVIRLTADAAARLFSKRPTLCVCGLNPHAGEGGLFGKEEETVIKPAVQQALSEGICVEGPLPPDTAFLPSRLRQTDAYVAMYHDQGHIPFKMHAFDRGVNITLGLPIVRTSVDHGTAFDIAWKGIANHNSMAQAILYAVRLAAGQQLQNHRT